MLTNVDRFILFTLTQLACIICPPRCRECLIITCIIISISRTVLILPTICGWDANLLLDPLLYGGPRLVYAFFCFVVQPPPPPEQPAATQIPAATAAKPAGKT
jgi:hypothetical protein